VVTGIPGRGESRLKVGIAIDAIGGMKIFQPEKSWVATGELGANSDPNPRKTGKERPELLQRNTEIYGF